MNTKENKFVNALKKADDKDNQSPSAQSRKGTKHIGGYFDTTVSKQLRQIALNEDTSVQRLVGEALNLLFQSRKLPTIAAD